MSPNKRNKIFCSLFYTADQINIKLRLLYDELNPITAQLSLKKSVL